MNSAVSHRKIFAGAMVAVVSILPAMSQAILYSATNLADTTPGQDLWEYSYTVNQTFQQNEGFTVYFPSDRFTLLQNSPPPVANFEILVTQRDSGANLPGFYDGLATSPVVAPSSGPFQIQFVYTGAPGTQPGSQSYEIYRQGVDTFTVLSQGNTVSLNPVPEPAEWVAMASLGLLGWAAIRRHQAKR